MYYMKWVLALLFAYFYGSINFAYLFVKMIKKVDLRKHGFGNPGASNAFNVGGPVAGILTMIFDISKAGIPIVAAHYIMSWSFQSDLLLLLTMPVAATLGHDFPFYWKFKGGEGLSIIYGTMLFFSPAYWLICNCIHIPFVVIKKNLNRKFRYAHLSVLLITIAASLLFIFEPVITAYLSWWKWVSWGFCDLFGEGYLTNTSDIGYLLLILMGFYVIFRRAFRYGFFQDLKDGINPFKAFYLRALFIMFPKESRYRNPGEDVQMGEEDAKKALT